MGYILRTFGLSQGKMEGKRHEDIRECMLDVLKDMIMKLKPKNHWLKSVFWTCRNAIWQPIILCKQTLEKTKLKFVEEITILKPIFYKEQI